MTSLPVVSSDQVLDNSKQLVRRQRRDGFARKVCPDSHQNNAFLAEFSNLGITSIPSNIYHDGIADTSGPWKTKQATKSACDVTAKEIDGNIFITQRYSKFSVSSYERTFKLKNASHSCIASSKPQRRLLPSPLSVNPIPATNEKPATAENVVSEKLTQEELDFSKDLSEMTALKTPSYNFTLWISMMMKFFISTIFASAMVKTMIDLRKFSQSFKKVIVIGLIMALSYVVYITYKSTIAGTTHNYSFSDLRLIVNSLESRLFGQHLVISKLSVDLGTFLRDPSIKMAFFLLLGCSGSGKTLTRRIIEEHLQKEGFSVLEWHLGGKKLPDFKIACQTISEKDSERLLFVLEDANEYLLSEVNLEKTMQQVKKCKKFKKCLVVITSTAFSREINKFMKNKYALGIRRSDLKEPELIASLQEKFTQFPLIKSLNQSADLKYSILPFLPLHEEHVRMCIKVELQRRKVSKQQWDLLANKALQLMYFSNENGNIISEGGCKLVKSRIDFVLN